MGPRAFLQFYDILERERGVDPDEDLIAEVDMELRNQDNSQQARTSKEEEDDATRGEMLKDVIAADMWHNYKNC
ncbi:hypothetical protein SLE2022_114420 [Rubroshorea leprosula]